MPSIDAFRVPPASVAGALLLACTGPWAVAPTLGADGTCLVDAPVGAGLEAAKSLFAERCPAHPRQDCDPVNGTWRCSSERIGTGAPGAIGAAAASGTAPTVPTTAFGTPSKPSAPARATPPAGPLAVDGSACTANGPSLSAARAAFAAACPGRDPVDCDPSGEGWMCASDVIGAAAPGGRTASIAPVPVAPTVPPPAAPVPPPSTPPEAPDAPAAPSAPGVPSRPGGLPPAPDQAPPAAPSIPAPVPGTEAPAPAPAIGRLRDGDLLALMYDNCSDPDDGHAAAAARAVVSRTGASEPWIVNGTCGANLERQFQSRSVALMNTVWGDAWVNANADRAGAVSASADAWAATLANGRDVWIAEGGPSDVTADIVREIAARYPSLDTRRLHVVQHSEWNETHTAAANLQLVRSATDYVKIDDGNYGGNGTADLNPTGDDFGRLTGAFVRTATSGSFATEWRAAFDYLPPGCPGRTEVCKLDFSDTAELLHILGDSSTRDVADFADRYLR